jgi:hypothetical protein
MAFSRMYSVGRGRLATRLFAGKKDIPVAGRGSKTGVVGVAHEGDGMYGRDVLAEGLAEVIAYIALLLQPLAGLLLPAAHGNHVGIFGVGIGPACIGRLVA